VYGCTTLPKWWTVNDPATEKSHQQQFEHEGDNLRREQKKETES
jgi:hypothetical protein